MIKPNGPGSPFQLLFSDVADLEPSLAAPFREIYPGDWHIPAYNDRPYVYSNFATSRDGRISYQIPGFSGGGDITQYSAHDIWLMGLLRVRADALLNGDVTVNLFPESQFTAEDVYPDDAAAFAALRQAEGYQPAPIFVILSLDGNVDFTAAPFQDATRQVVIATTSAGADHIGQPQTNARVDIHDLGPGSVDLPRLVEILNRDYGVRNLLCEGGARVQAGMLAAHLIDEEFVTLCPTFVGRDDENFRPSYTEGVAWQPKNAPYSKPISLHRAGDLLYMRTQCHYKK